MARKKLTDAQEQFINGDDVNTEVSQQVNTEANAGADAGASRLSEGESAASRLRRASHGESATPIDQISNDIGSNLKRELFGDRARKESSIRFTVDIPESLNKRLAQLSVDTGKPKTELVRTILDRALNSLDY